MADDVNANIRIDLDTSDATASLKTLQAQISAFNQSIIKSNATAVAAQKGMLSTLTAQIGATQQFTTSMVNVESSVSRLGRAIDKNKLSLGEYFRYGVASSKNFGRVFGREHTAIMELATDRVKRLQTQYIALGEAQNGMTRAMAVRPMNLFNADAAIAVQRQQLFNKFLNDGSTSLINFGKNTQWAGRQLMVGFTVPLTIFGGIAGRIFMDLERQIVNFRRVYGDATTPLQETNGMIEQIKELGAEFTKYGIAVKDTITLASDAAAAGAQGADLLAQTEQATRLATLGMMQQQEALTATIALQSAFGLSSEQLGESIDFLNAVENQTVLSLQDVAEAIPRVAPIIKGLGGDVQDLAIFLAAMREGGVNAAEGSNALKSGLASLINPTKNAREQLEKVGINIDNILNTNKGDLRATVMEFGAALSTLDQFERQQTLAKVFGKFQFARLGALFENINKEGSQAQRVVDLTGESLEELNQLAEKELGAIADSVGVKFTGAVERFKLAIAPIGEVFLRVATPIIDFATNLAEKFNELSPNVKNFIAVLAAGFGVVVPTVIMLIGLFANFAGNIVKGFSLINNLFNRVRSGAGSLEYLSSEQLDAAAAASSLEGQTTSLTGALNIQRSAVNQLARAYGTYTAAAQASAANLPQGFRRPPRQMATGGLVGGVGNKDSEPALLTPGEFVMNKGATQKFGPILDAMNRGSISQLAEGSRLTQRTHLTGAVSVSATEAMLERVTNSTRQMLSVIQQVEQVLGKSVSSIAKVSNLIVEMPTQFNQAMKSGIGQSQFATEFGAFGVEKFKTTAAIAKQDFETLRPHLEILDKEIVNASKDFAVVSDMNIDEITKKAFARLPEESRKMLSEIEALSSQYNNLRVTVQDLNRLTAEEKQRLEAAGISFRTGADPNRQYITAPGMGTASTRTRQETRSAGPTYRRSPLFLSPNVVQESKQLAIVASKAAGDVLVKEMSEASKRAGKAIAPNIMLGANAASPPPWSIQLGGWIGQGIEKGMVTSLSDVNEKLRTQMMAPQGGYGGFLLPPGPTSPLSQGNTQNLINQTAQATASVSKIKGAANKFSSALSRGGMKIQGAFFALDGLVFGASMMNNSIGQFAQKILPAVFAVQGLTFATQGLTRVMPLLANPMVAVIAAVAALGIGMWKVNDIAKNIVEKGGRLVEAMTGTTKGMENIAGYFGRQTVTQELTTLQASRAAGKEIAPEKVSEAQSFMQSDAGKKLIEDYQFIRENLGSGKAAQGFANQIKRAILSGALPPEMGVAIASAAAAELKDKKLAALVSGEIKEYIGLDGEKITSAEGRLRVYADIFADAADVQRAAAEASAIWAKEWWGGQVAMILTGRGTSDIVAQQLGTAVVASQQMIQEQLAANELAYQKGEISARKFLEINNQILESAKLQGATWEGVKQRFELAYPDMADQTDIILQTVVNPFLDTLRIGLGEAAADGIISGLENVIAYGDAATGLKINLFDPEEVRQGLEGFRSQIQMLKDQMDGATESERAILESQITRLENAATRLQNMQRGAMNIAVAVQSGQLSPEALSKLFEGRPEKSVTLMLGAVPDELSIQFLNLVDQLNGEGNVIDIGMNFVMTGNMEDLQKLLLATTNIGQTTIDPNKIINEDTMKTINATSDALNRYQRDIDGLNKKQIKDKTVNFLVNGYGIAKERVDWFLSLDPVQQRTFLTVYRTVIATPEIAQTLTPGSSAAGGMGAQSFAQIFATAGKTLNEQIEEASSAVTDEEKDGGGGDKTKSWLEQLLIDIKANLALFVGNLEKGVKPIVNRLRKLGISEQIIDAIGGGEEGLKRAREIIEMSNKERNAFIERQNRATVGEFIRGPGGLRTQNIEKQNKDEVRKRLQDRGVEKGIIDKILDDEKAINAVLVANNDEIKLIIANYTKLQTPQEIIDAKVKEIKENHEETVKILDQQIEAQQEIIDAIEDQIDVLEEKNAADQWAIRNKEREKELIDRQIEALERANEMDERRIDALQRQDELRNREAEALSRELEQLSLAEEQIRQTYQDRIEALDKVAEINSFIVNQQRQQLGLSQALAQGDIFAATAAAQEMRQSQAEFAQQQARAGLEQGAEAAVAGLRTAGGLTREQAEKQIANIKEQSYQTSLLIRDIEDQIFARNEQIVPLKDLQYQIDLAIRDIADAIFNRETEIYNIREQQLDPQQKILDNLNKQKSDMQKITDETINQIEALSDSGQNVEDITKGVDLLARAWTNVNNEIAKANKTAREKLEGLGDYPTPQAGETNRAYAERVAKWTQKRQEIEAQRQGAVNAAFAQGNAAMEANARSITPSRSTTYTTQQQYQMGAVGGGGGLRRFAGGMINYKGSNEPPPAQMMGGGKVKKYPMGGLIPYADGGKVFGRGAMDSVNALLTPGEFVVRRAMVDKYGIPMLNALNQGAFGMPKYRLNQTTAGNVTVKSQNTSNIVAPMYNNYSVNVSVSNANASADEIANRTIMKIKQMQDMQIRSSRGY